MKIKSGKPIEISPLSFKKRFLLKAELSVSCFCKTLWAKIPPLNNHLSCFQNIFGIMLEIRANIHELSQTYWFQNCFQPKWLICLKWVRQLFLRHIETSSFTFRMGKKFTKTKMQWVLLHLARIDIWHHNLPFFLDFFWHCWITHMVFSPLSNFNVIEIIFPCWSIIGLYYKFCNALFLYWSLK